MTQRALVEHIFRHEYGLLVAILMKRVGAQHIDAVEDSVQFAMMKALDSWSRTRTPDNPNAWLYQVAYHQLLSEFRTLSRRQNLLDEQQPDASTMLAEHVEPPLPSEMEDSMLRMIYVACHEGIPLGVCRA